MVEMSCTDPEIPQAMLPAHVPAGPSRWQIFHSNEKIWPAVLELCDSARTSLAIEQYIFGADTIGTRLMDVLTKAARRGVHVRLLVDAFGSAALARSPAGDAFRQAGGELVRYNPSESGSCAIRSAACTACTASRSSSTGAE